MPKYTCIFAHFNSQAGISGYIHTYLEQLTSLGFRIIFISNSPVNGPDRLRLEKITGVYRIAERENKGNDFGAWQWALAHDMIPEDTEHLLLTNDSIFGPLSSLEPLMQKMCGDASLDFWGLTDSYQGGWHIQSYFICLNRRAFGSDAFKKVFSQDFSGFDKKNIIEKGEIRLSRALSDAGFNGRAYFAYEKLDPGCLTADLKNPTHFFWHQLVQKLSFPFVKKELILFNPERLQSVGEVFSLLEKMTDYQVENIKECIIDHLRSRGVKPGMPALPDPVSVLCHLYYPGTVYSFLSKLAVLRSPHTQFIFNLSGALAQNGDFVDILTRTFKDAIILFTPNQGRDIGGKLAAIDALLKCHIQTAYSLVLHDKISPHTPTGQEWSNDLLKIIDPQILPKVFSRFHKDPETGIITSANFIKNEFDPDRAEFACTSSDNLNHYIKEYDLKITDYHFAAGTIFWIRTGILREFFSVNAPLSVRRGLEPGNTLDFSKGTNIHAWERLFSFITGSQGYKTTGIH